MSEGAINKAEDGLLEVAGFIALAIILLFIFGVRDMLKKATLPDNLRPDSLFSSFVGWGENTLAKLPHFLSAPLKTSFEANINGLWPIVEKMPWVSKIGAPDTSPPSSADVTMSNRGDGTQIEAPDAWSPTDWSSAISEAKIPETNLNGNIGSAYPLDASDLN